jgi:hypothetical protein
MAFKAILKLDDCNQMNVFHCTYHVAQMTDTTGKATSLPVGGTVNVVVESDETTHLFDFVKHPTLKKNGSIVFFKNNSISPLKTLKFIDAICVGYHETFSQLGSQPMQIELTLSAREIHLNGSIYSKDWPISDTGEKTS